MSTKCDSPKWARILCAALVIGASGFSAIGEAKAAVVDVKEIVITSAYAGMGTLTGISLPGFLQVSEVVALNGSSIDQALAATASATAVSSYLGTSPGKAIDGIGPAAFPSIYHSGERGVGEALTITFTTPFELAVLNIFGRSGTTAPISNRDVYDVEIFNSLGASIFTAFDQSAANGEHLASIDLSPVTPVPVPAALPLMAGGLSLMGLIGWRRKRKIASGGMRRSGFPPSPGEAVG